MKRSHICISKILTDLCFTKLGIKTKNTFVEVVYSEHKEICLSINDAQSVRLEKGTIKFKYYFKQMFRKCWKLWRFLLKKHQDHIPCSFAYKLVCVDDEFTKPIVVFKGENAAYEFIKAILKEYQYCKKVMKKHFNKTLIMSE